MKFNKVDYTKLKLGSSDKVSKSLIRQQIQQTNNSQLTISPKQTKQSVKVLSKQNNPAKNSFENNL